MQEGAGLGSFFLVQRLDMVLGVDGDKGGGILGRHHRALNYRHSWQVGWGVGVTTIQLIPWRLFCAFDTTPSFECRIRTVVANIMAGRSLDARSCQPVNP